MVPIAERLRAGIITQAAQRARDLLRGFSEADIVRQRRLCAGAITLEDRQLHTRGQIDALFSRYFPSHVSPTDLTGQIGTPSLDVCLLDVASFRKKLEELREKPEKIIDEEIRAEAAKNLDRWGIK